MKKLLLLLSLFAFNAFATPVNINTADAETISEALSGIGMKKAEAIVKYRTEKGLFKTAEELTNVKGIGEKILAKNKKDILLSDTPGAEPAAVAPPAAVAAPKTAAEPKAAEAPKKAK
jgi:competence protein ComEA